MQIHEKISKCENSLSMRLRVKHVKKRELNQGPILEVYKRSERTRDCFAISIYHLGIN